jgi:hypothetical protein
MSDDLRAVDPIEASLMNGRGMWGVGAGVEGMEGNY